MYTNYNYLFSYLQQLDQYVRSQQNEINHLQKELSNLARDMNEFKKTPSTTIERIEYKFDQLKVETLEGTLNIGLNPYQNEQIEDFAVNNGKIKTPPIDGQIPSNVYDYIRDSINEYLDKDGNQIIEKIHRTLGVPLNDSYYDFMKQDVKRQLDGRIQYYLNQVSQENWHHEERALNASEQVINRLKTDIEQAFTSFIQHLPNEWKSE